MLKRSKRGNMFIQCIVGMAILLCFILMSSTYNFMQLNRLRRSMEFEKISDYIMNFKREISMEETILNTANMGEVFYLGEGELKYLYIKDIKNIVKEEREEDSILKIEIVEVNEYTNKIRITCCREKVEVEDEAYVWKTKKRAYDDRSYMLNCIYRDNKLINM